MSGLYVPDERPVHEAGPGESGPATRRAGYFVTRTRSPGALTAGVLEVPAKLKR